MTEPEFQFLCALTAGDRREIGTGNMPGGIGEAVAKGLWRSELVTAEPHSFKGGFGPTSGLLYTITRNGCDALRLELQHRGLPTAQADDFATLLRRTGRP